MEEKEGEGKKITNQFFRNMGCSFLVVLKICDARL